MEEKKENPVHHGHNIRRIRTAQHIKQSALADSLGVSQQTVARLEKQPILTEEKIQKLAQALNVPSQIIKEMEEDPVNIVFENNTFETGSIPNSIFGKVENYTSIETLKEVIEQNNRMFERLLEQERERIKLLEELLKQKKKE